MKARIAAALIALALPASAQAAPPWQHWVHQMRTPLPPALDVRLDDCPPEVTEGALPEGCTWPGGPVYVSVFPDDLDETRATLYHEIGHQFDWQVGTHHLRQQFRHLARVHGPWEQDGPRDPHELFADAYAICSYPRAVQADRFEDDGWVESESYGYRARWRAHRRFCRSLRLAAALVRRPAQ